MRKHIPKCWRTKEGKRCDKDGLFITVETLPTIRCKEHLDEYLLEFHPFGWCTLSVWDSFVCPDKNHQPHIGCDRRVVIKDEKKNNADE